MAYRSLLVLLGISLSIPFKLNGLSSQSPPGTDTPVGGGLAGETGALKKIIDFNGLSVLVHFFVDKVLAICVYVDLLPTELCVFQRYFN